MEPIPTDRVETSSSRFWLVDQLAFHLYTFICVIYAARLFYSAMHAETRGMWSAPLDDVFIHFDYARSLARGFPFQWSPGNGISSGNTSITYPFVLAVGFLFGFRGLFLMKWAAIVASASLVYFLSRSAKIFEPLGSWAKYVAPPLLLSLGALDWSLFSGMENAFHLAVWAFALSRVFSVIETNSASARTLRTRAIGAGFAGLLLLFTRPESIVTVATFAVFTWFVLRRRGARTARMAAWLVMLPAAIGVFVQAIFNRVSTGEWSASGAIVKLALNNPYMTGEEKWSDYLFHLKYIFTRVVDHHFADAMPWGLIIPVFALVPLLMKRTRGIALLLWAQVLSWSLLIALNGQVRWQNERYAMPAVAWLLLAFALGVACLVANARDNGRIRPSWPFRVALAGGAVFLYVNHGQAKMNDQIWFFARASRNIRDQHIVAGGVLAKLAPQRVLVGDAGALMFQSDRPGLDIIGLGGYHELPFARASVHGLGASLELIEHIVPSDRPDVMAIYPTWWGDLPVLFGTRILSFPVFGNVICGGFEKVIYRANWETLERQALPTSLKPGERIVDELDVGDLVSERNHRYQFPRPHMGYVDFRVLRAAPGKDVFDAGRTIPKGQVEQAELDLPKGESRLLVRSAPKEHVSLSVRISGKPVGELVVIPRAGWSEGFLNLPPQEGGRTTIELEPIEGDWLNAHIWVVESKRDAGKLAGE